MVELDVGAPLVSSQRLLKLHTLIPSSAKPSSNRGGEGARKQLRLYTNPS